MIQHLRKTTLSLALFAFIFGAFTVQTYAQELTTVWERTARTGAELSIPDWFTAGYVRGIAYGNEHIYAADRTNSTIRAIDAATGADINLATAFDLSGVAGGTYSMNDIEASDDGVIFLGNLTVDANASPFRLYWWTEEGGAYADSLTLTTAEASRLGDKFTVVGSVAENTVEVWMPAAGSNPGLVYVATTTDQGATWDVETITLSGDVSEITSNTDAAPLATGRDSDFYLAGNSLAPTRFDNSGAFVAGSQISTGSRNGLQAFEVDGVDHLAVYTYRPEGVASGNKTGQVYVYDVSDATSPATVFESPLLGDDADTYSSIHGEAEVSVAEDNTFNVYALEGVNGLAAFNNVAPPYIDDASNLFFSEYIEGSSNNKALEIYNNTDSTVTLANYQIAQSSNGGGWEFYFDFAGGATVESGGTYVLTTDQVDGSLYDIVDADEALGYPSPIHFNGNDARALIHIDAATNDTTWLDVFGDPDSDAYWEVGGVEEASAEHTLLRKASVMEGNTTALGSFGTDVASTEWIVNAQDDFSNLGLATPTTTPLSGDYYIAKGFCCQGFDSLSAAITALNEAGLSGPTNFIIDADLEEHAQLRINRDDLTAINSLTIKSSSGEQVTVRTNDFRIVDSRYITIDGSASGTDSRNLTFEKSGEGGGFIGLLSNTFEVNFKSVNITYADTLGADTYAVLINRREGSEETGRAENVTFENVRIGSPERPFNDGVWLFGSGNNPSYFHQNVSFLNNELHVGRSAVRTQTHTNTVFSGNVVKAYGTNAGEIPVFNLNTPIESFTFTNNEISFVGSGGTEARTFIGLNATNTLIENVMIANNTFTSGEFSGDVAEHSFIGFRHAGTASAANFQLYHNTFLLTEEGQSGLNAIIAQTLEASNAASVEAVNNIFVNEHSAANSYIYSWGGAGLTANNNNIETAGISAVASIEDEIYPSLSALGDSLGLDTNSTTASVQFVSDADLRLSGSSIGDNELGGTPLASVTTDIDGKARSETVPYKGAFEGDVALSSEVEIGTFALLSPEDGFELNLMGDLETEIEITWEEPATNEDVTYTWLADSAGGDFSEPLLSISSDDEGSETTLTLTYEMLNNALIELGVEEGGSIDLSWTVTASAGETQRFANESFYLTITRNLGVSNEPDETPDTFTLSQNYPNPFNPTSNIQFTLPEASNVRLEVFNTNGQLVSTLVNNRLGAGEHTVKFDGANLASGIYIYRIIAGNFVQTKKMTLIK